MELVDLMEANSSSRPSLDGLLRLAVGDEQQFVDFTDTNSSMSNFTCPALDMTVSKVVVTVVYSFVFFFGLLGNFMVIYVVLRFSNMQTVTNMYILNLAIADVCFLAGIPFLLVTMHYSSWIFGKTLCKIYMVSTSITQFTSSIFLLVMSADRYIAICHHISSPKYRTPMVSRIVSALAWIVSASIMVPIMVFAGTIETGPNRYSCNVMWPESYDHVPGFTFTIYSVCLGFVIPLLFIMTFYVLVIRKLQAVSQRSTKSKNKRRSHRKVTKLVVTVVAVYILCWSPHWMAQVALIVNTSEMCPTLMHVFLFLSVGLLGYCNSAVNPILYAYLSENFQKSFQKALGPFARRRDINAPINMTKNHLPKRIRTARLSESQLTVTTRCPTTYMESNTFTTVTGVSNVSSRNPSPPTDRNGSISRTEQDNDLLPLAAA